MEEKAFHNLKNNMTIHLLGLIVLGFIILFATTTGIPYIIEIRNLTKESSKFLYPILTAIKPIAEPFAYILMGIGAIILSIKKIAFITWQNSGEVAIEEVHKTIADNLKKISTDNESLAEKVKNYIKDLERPITIGQCNNREDYKSFSNMAARGIYGPHVGNGESFYSFIENHSLDPYCNLPHPSKAKKRIKISPTTERPGFVGWEEHTSFNIHHVTYALTRSDEEFKVKYNTNAYAPGLTPEEWAECLSLKVTIDGETILRSGDKPKEDKDSTKDGFYFKADGDWVSFRFQKTVTLTKEWTSVEIYDRSINSEDDMTFSLNATRPVYGYEIDLTVMDDQCIDRSPFVSPFIAYTGLPEFSKKEVSRKYKKPEQDSENHMNITMDGWVLPGIVATINWAKKK